MAPHNRAVPVTPGEINEYAIRFYPFSFLIKPGHRIQLELDVMNRLMEKIQSYCHQTATIYQAAVQQCTKFIVTKTIIHV